MTVNQKTEEQDLVLKAKNNKFEWVVGGRFTISYISSIRFTKITFNSIWQNKKNKKYKAHPLVESY